MGAASVLMGNGSSDTGIAPLWVIPLTTWASWASLPRQEPPLLPAPSSQKLRWNMPSSLYTTLPCSSKWARVAAYGPEAWEGAGLRADSPAPPQSSSILVGAPRPSVFLWL